MTSIFKGLDGWDVIRLRNLGRRDDIGLSLWAWWTMEGGSWHCTGDRDQDHPHGKERQKAKWLSGEALQIAVKRREAKSKGEKERYKHLNAEFQRISRRDKKAFLSDQCKEIEENNRMGKTRDLFKKIRYQGNISCKDGLNKGQKWYGPNRSRRY